MDENNLNAELIARCLDKSASEAEKQELLQWINESKENESLYFTMKELYEAGNWNTLRQEADTIGNWQQLRTKIDESNQPAKNKKFRIIHLVKYAAILVLGAVISVMFLKLNSSKNINPEFKNQIVTGIGERSQLVLPDGTKVWVNSCSSVSYKYDYGTNSRNVYLEGEAYFKVTKNEELPFIVHTQGAEIKALGTAFNVTAYHNDVELSAVLLEGSISFKQVGNENAQVIKPGEKITYSKSTQLTNIEEVNAESYVAWSNGETSFEHLKMDEITKRLQRNYHVTFVLQNEKIKNMHFTGTFRNYESLEQILKVISTNTDLNCKIIRDTVFMK